MISRVLRKRTSIKVQRICMQMAKITVVCNTVRCLPGLSICPQRHRRQARDVDPSIRIVNPRTWHLSSGQQFLNNVVLLDACQFYVEPAKID